MDKTKTIIIVVIAILVASNIFLGYMLLKPKPARGNFQMPQITDEQKANVTAFFTGSPSQADATTYCASNRIECFYYCRTVDPSNALCSSIMPSRSNYQGGYPSPQQPAA